MRASRVESAQQLTMALQLSSLRAHKPAQPHFSSCTTLGRSGLGRAGSRGSALRGTRTASARPRCTAAPAERALGMRPWPSAPATIARQAGNDANTAERIPVNQRQHTLRPISAPCFRGGAAEQNDALTSPRSLHKAARSTQADQLSGKARTEAHSMEMASSVRSSSFNTIPKLSVVGPANVVKRTREGARELRNTRVSCAGLRPSAVYLHVQPESVKAAAGMHSSEVASHGFCLGVDDGRASLQRV